jgi:integrase
MAKYTIYKYVRTDKGWRYCKAAFHPNGKIKPNVVIIGGREQRSTEGRYFLNYNNTWIDVGEDALEAQRRRQMRLAQIEYERLGGRVPAVDGKPAPEPEMLWSAMDAYLAEIESAVRSKNKRQASYKLMECTLRKFEAWSKLERVDQITARHLDGYAGHIIETSPTHSVMSGRNEYVRMLQFLKSRGVTLTKKDGRREVPVGLKDAPKTTKGQKVVTNTEEEVEKFLASCKPGREHTMFFALLRSGLRLMELATLRWQDVVLDRSNPHLVVCDRTVGGFEFRVKWYAARTVTIDSALVEALRKWKAVSRDELVFARRGKLDRHIHRTCKSIARKAGLDPRRFKPHRFRANFATACLRSGMDLETLRAQLGHRDTESLRHYIVALQGEERVSKVNAVWLSAPHQMAANSWRKGEQSSDAHDLEEMPNFARGIERRALRRAQDARTALGN